jgi:DNA-binding response OmpR family regulator
MPPDGPSYAVQALVVDDEKEVADAYALRLDGYCHVKTAYSGREALDMIEREPVDVVLLDRHMPDMSGDQVLTELDDREFYGRIVMVTAVDPDFGVLNLPFDDYLCKPVDREDVRAAVDHQRIVLAYETLGKYFSVESKRTVVEAETTAQERKASDEYTEITHQAARLERRARRLLGDDDELLDQFHKIGREGF